MPTTKIASLTPRIQIAMTAEGVITESMSPLIAATKLAPATQTVFGSLLGLRAGDVVTGVAFRNATAASGTAPTTARFGIADKTGKILAVSANVNAATSWPAGAVAIPFSAAYTVASDGGYFACFVVNGTWGTTQPTPIGGASFWTAAETALGSNTIPIFSWTGQTDLPAVNSSLTITSAGAAVPYYLAFY